MSVQRFRSIEAMSAAAVESPRDLESRLRALWARTASLLPPWDRPCGVFKFRTFDELQRQREDWERQRARRGHPRRA